MHTCFGEIDFQDSRKTQVLNYLGRIYYATKLTRRKKSHRTKNLGFLRNEWSSFDRLLQPESTTRGSGIMTISYRKPKTLNRLRISLAPDKVLFLATSASGTWFSEINIFGVRYVLTYSPNHSSAQDVKHLDHQCDSLWSTEVIYEDPSDEACATMQYLSVLLRNQITYLETQV